MMEIKRTIKHRMSFKQTISKRIKCDICKKDLRGVDGFISLKFFDSNSWEDITDYLCLKCYKEMNEEIEKAIKHKKRDWKIHTRKQMLKKLS